MLITPRPGASRETIRQLISDIRLQAENFRGATSTVVSYRLLRYLEWATDAARVLRNQVSDADIDHLIFTRRYQALLSSCSTLGGQEQARLTNGLIDLELTERIQALEEAGDDLQSVISRWGEPEVFIVADSSFYIHSPQPLADLDLHQVVSVLSSDNIRLLFPIAVIDELDGLKESGKHRARWRASHTLGLLDKTLNGNTSGLRRRAGFANDSNKSWGNITFEIVLDPPGHERLPITDDEIIDRAVAIQSLAGREVRLLTCDTGQHTRGCAAGLTVTKVPAKDPGPEPDWEAVEKPGLRAERRMKQGNRDLAAADGPAADPAVR
ncbi:PIN domain-containing protein [Streptomyces sp. AC627_RSS907]|uniref:PIN domain-containing protein n=1 Tax=Streptomyces sp. AC627_RSS907 TaxID=2823684 RepID=UPI001C2297BF|nr:PIN domain-containing protein [Streptomyces sp. AC627_RSS907]